MDKKEIDLTNKVILDVDAYLKLKEEIINLKNNVEIEKKKYENLIIYLFSACRKRKYTSGKVYLEYNSYHNDLGIYLEKIEPEMYKAALESREEDE